MLGVSGNGEPEPGALLPVSAGYGPGAALGLHPQESVAGDHVPHGHLAPDRAPMAHHGRGAGRKVDLALDPRSARPGAHEEAGGSGMGIRGIGITVGIGAWVEEVDGPRAGHGGIGRVHLLGPRVPEPVECIQHVDAAGLGLVAVGTDDGPKPVLAVEGVACGRAIRPGHPDHAIAGVTGERGDPPHHVGHTHEAAGGIVGEGGRPPVRIDDPADAIDGRMEELRGLPVRM